MKNKKIALFMLPLLTQGAGAEKYFIELARNLAQKGITVDVLTLDENFFKKFARLLHIFYAGDFFGKIDISGRESEETVKENLGNARWIKSSFKDLKKKLNDYDVIYSKNEIVDLFLLKMAGYKKLPPIIVGVHTPIFYQLTDSFFSKLHNFLYQSFLYKWLLRGVSCVHLSNKFTKDLVSEKFKIKTRLIYYPFSVDDIKKRALEAVCNHEFNGKKLNIVFIARLSEQKGINDLATIINELSQSKEVADRMCMNIFGSGGKKEEDIVSDLSKKYEFVKYFGHIENKYVPSVLLNNDLFISTAKWETLPFNVLEAQAMGLPVIAYDIPGPSDIIVNNITGYLVKSKEEFLDKISKFKKDDFDKEKISEHIKNKFDPDIIYEKILGMFEDNS